MRTGILLINTGTTEAPTDEAVRACLAEFLTDPMLFKMSMPIWKIIVHHVVLPSHPKPTLWRYRAIWADMGSRFMLASQEQRSTVERMLSERGFSDGDFMVSLAMRYGKPSIAGAMDELHEAGCTRVVCVPLYP